MLFHSTDSNPEAGSNIVYTGARQTPDKPMFMDNLRVDKNPDMNLNFPVFAESIRFTSAGAGELAAITDNVTAVSGKALSVTAVSAAAAAAMQAQIAALTAQVATLTSGFCPPPATTGRHLLADLMPIVAPAGCVKAPAAVTNPTHLVTTTLSLTGINLATFSPSSVAAALAAVAGINAADVDIVVTDYPVSTTVSFTGVSLTSLTAAETAAITSAIDAKLPAVAMTPVIGAVTPAGRRLLDLSFPVTVTGVGASTTLAAQTQTAVTSAATLGAAATAANVPSSAVTATPAAVGVVMSVTVRAASAASAANIATALSPANAAAISMQLTASGVSHTGLTITPPVVGAAPSTSASISGQDEKDLLALLVLLVIPVAAGAYFGGKYLERHRSAKAQEQAQAKAGLVEDPVVVVEPPVEQAQAA